MKFTLEISCDNAAFAPVHDDASEPERYEAALAQIGFILRRQFPAVSPRQLNERSGFLRDENGNRCGQWSISEGEEG